jgi:PilZ domain-containing protein
VTPKGIVSGRRAFDAASSRLTIAAAVVTAGALAKGLAEFSLFGIEKDAYFFNLAWAASSLVALAAALLVAWEKPQRRTEERVPLAVPVTVRCDGGALAATSADLGLGGASLDLAEAIDLPAEVDLAFALAGEAHALRARVVRNEGERGGARCGVAFVGLGPAERRALVRGLFGQAATWRGAHDGRPAHGLGMALALLRGIAGAFAPGGERRRRTARRRDLRLVDLVWEGGAARALIRDRSRRGLALWAFGSALPPGDLLPVLSRDGAPAWARVVHRRRIAPGVWRLGLEMGTLPAGAAPRVYLAA